MSETLNTIENLNDITVSTIYCVNTGRTYVYEIKNGQIISEKRFLD